MRVKWLERVNGYWLVSLQNSDNTHYACTCTCTHSFYCSSAHKMRKDSSGIYLVLAITSSLSFPLTWFIFAYFMTLNNSTAAVTVFPLFVFISFLLLLLLLCNHQLSLSHIRWHTQRCEHVQFAFIEYIKQKNHINMLHLLRNTMFKNGLNLTVCSEKRVSAAYFSTH